MCVLLWWWRRIGNRCNRLRPPDLYGIERASTLVKRIEWRELNVLSNLSISCHPGTLNRGLVCRVGKVKLELNFLIGQFVAGILKIFLYSPWDTPFVWTPLETFGALPVIDALKPSLCRRGFYVALQFDDLFLIPWWHAMQNGGCLLLLIREKSSL